jgi:NodT family efflux transporter outer membrane factor (OMF) lipoprotein
MMGARILRRLRGSTGLCVTLLGAPVLLMAGCAVGPDYHPTKTETKLPDGWDGTTVAEPAQPSVATTEVAQLSEWWNVLNDPKLTQLVTDSLKANLDLRTAISALRQARATRDVAASGFWPTVNATGAYSRGGPLGGGRAGDLFQDGLNASWQLDFFGSTRRAIESADANVEAAGENMRNVLITVAAEVATDYVNVRGFQQRIQVANDNLKAQQHTAELTRQKFQGGLATALDVANAEASVAATEATIPPLETSERQTIYALSVLLARPPAALKDELSTPGPIPQAPARVPVGLPSALLQRRPDIRQSEALVHAATAQIGVATAQWYPQFSLTGNLGFASDTLRGLLRSDNGSWSLGPSVTWPIFTAGRIAANVEVQNAAQEQALLAYQKTVLTALQEVESALVAFALEQRHRQLLDQAVKANSRALDLATQLYTIGQNDFLSVIVAQQALLSTQDALQQSNQAIAVDLIALYNALGGGWESKPESQPQQ